MFDTRPCKPGLFGSRLRLRNGTILDPPGQPGAVRPEEVCQTSRGPVRPQEVRLELSGDEH